MLRPSTVTRGAALLAAATLMSACGTTAPSGGVAGSSTSTSTSTPTVTSSVASPSPTVAVPASSAAPSLVLDGSEVARLDVTAESVQATDGDVDAGNRYDVVSTCSGVDSMTYRVLVDGQEVSSGHVGCGAVQRNTAVTGRDGRVDLELGPDSPAFTGEARAAFAVIPADAL